jgi:GNAT superfamily N-acetyltransferase
MFKFLPIESDADARANYELRNVYVSYSPKSFEEMLELDRTRPTDLEFHRWMELDAEGNHVARLNLAEQRRGDGEKGYILDVIPARDRVDAFDAGLQFLMEQARLRGANHLSADARDDWDGLVDATLRNGFEERQRNPLSQLDLETVDWSRWDPRVTQLEREGIRFTNLKAESDRLGSREASHHIWRLHMDVGPDIPMPEPFTESPFEEFYRFQDDPYFVAETIHMAFDGDLCVATSEIGPNHVDPRYAATYLTGVRREYRRRGLAAALKAVALRDAARRGIRWVTTDNEENNPMYQLNLQLGFTKQFDWVLMTRMA